MEEKINGEQLELSEENVQKTIVENEEDGTTCLMDNNSSLGKFKDANSLLNAYNNLQAEFTRKCQKLSELSKKYNEEETDVDNKDDSSCKEESELACKNDEAIFETSEWKEKVELFLQKNDEAKEYSGEIANEILNNKDLQTSPYALELAWANVIKREYKKPQELANDQKFISEQILTKDEVKKQVIEEYFKNIQDKKIPPLISKSGSVAGITYKEPSTMKEAKEAVIRLFNLKGN